jgi:Leucine-rich repeat (LRR) protein
MNKDKESKVRMINSSPLVDLVIEVDTNNQRKQLLQTQMQNGTTIASSSKDSNEGRSISDEEDVGSSYYYCNDESTTTTSISTHLSSKYSAVVDMQRKELLPPLPSDQERLEALHAYWKEKECLAQEQRRNGIPVPIGYFIGENDKKISNNIDSQNLVQIECSKLDDRSKEEVDNEQPKILVHVEDEEDLREMEVGCHDVNEDDSAKLVASQSSKREKKAATAAAEDDDEEEDEDVNSQLVNVSESCYSSSSSSCSDDDVDDNDDDASTSFPPKNNKVGVVDSNLIIVDFRREDEKEQKGHDLDSCSTATSGKNNSFISTQNKAATTTTKIKEAILFQRIEALAFSTTSTSSKLFNDKVKNLTVSSVEGSVDADLEIGSRTTGYDNETKEDQFESSTGSVVTTESHSFCNFSRSRSSSSISFSKPRDEDATTYHRSNVTGVFGRRLVSSVTSASSNRVSATPSLRNRIYAVFHDLLHFLRNCGDQFRYKMKEDDFRTFIYVWCSSVLIGIIFVMIFLTASHFSTKNGTSLTPREILIQNKLSLLASSTAALQDSSTPQYKALQWILFGEHSNPLNYDSPNLIQRYCLAVLYYASNGDHWVRCGQSPETSLNTSISTCLDEHGKLSYRFLSSQDECSWFGIRCTNGNVASIVLQNNNLVGSFPSELCELQNLSYLVLSNNLLEGAVPNNLRKLQNLRTVLLNQNKFSTIFSDSISQLPNLNILSLGYNQFHGTLPKEMFSSKECLMSMLDLGHNMFSGTIPLELFHCENMEKISLEGNQLTGTIPYEFGNLQKLELLILSSNALTGSINSLMFYPNQQLQYFDVQKNYLSGSLPETLFSSAISLTTLNLGYNKFSGTLPLNFANLKKMKNLYVLSNHFTGTIPSTIGTQMSQLGLCQQR